MDYLKECMNEVGNPPLDAMQRNFCVVCANRDCERAGLNQSAFDHRVKNWRSLLFDNVPRADEADEAYSNIRSKHFMPGGPRKPPTTTVFMPGVPVIRPPAAEETAPETPRETEGEQEGLELEPVAAPPPVPQGAAAPLPGNTSFEQGMILPGAPAAPAEKAEPRPSPGTTFILEDD